MAALLCACGLLQPSAAGAQVLYGSIVGNVQDSSGATLPGATVTITSQETNLDAHGGDERDGRLQLHQRAGGHLRRQGVAAGIQGVVKTDVPVTVNAVSRVDEPRGRSAHETVTVQSESQLLQTDKADTHTEIKSTEITAAAAAAESQLSVPDQPGSRRDARRAAEQRGGYAGPSAHDERQRPQPEQQRHKTDGATNVNVWLPHHTMYVSPAETIDTVNVSTSNFDAEQGMAGGAAITVITKSGTNEFKGSAFEFYNNQNLNATPYFVTEKKDSSFPHHRRDARRTVQKNKLFFFGVVGRAIPEDAESELLRRAARRAAAGDFSQAFNATAACRSSTIQSLAMRTGRDGRRFRATDPGASASTPSPQKIQALFRQPNLPGSAGANVAVRARRATTCRTEPQIRPQQLRLQGQLEPVAAGAGVGQVLPDGRNRRPRRRLLPGIRRQPPMAIRRSIRYTFGTTWTLNPTTVFDATMASRR